MFSYKRLACLSLALLCCASVLSRNAATKNLPKFSSAYTDLDKECKDAYKDSGAGQDIPGKCKGYGGYYIYISYSAIETYVSIKLNGDENYDVAMKGEGFTYPTGRKVEWRMADGVPFAVIMRLTTYKEDPEGVNPYQEKLKSGESLIIKGLKGYEAIDFAIDAKQPNANLKAREMADGAYAKGRAD